MAARGGIKRDTAAVGGAVHAVPDRSCRPLLIRKPFVYSCIEKKTLVPAEGVGGGADCREPWGGQQPRAKEPMLNRFRFYFIFLAVILAPQLAWGQKQPSSPTLAEGREVFQQRCATCHGMQGQGASSVIAIAGPNIQAVHNPQDVIHRVETGKGIMPSFAKILSKRQIDSVAAYVTQELAVIPLLPGDASAGGELFRENCASCHRTAVRGGALAFTGVNAPSLVGKDAAIVAGAIRSGPGPMPKFSRAEISNKQMASIVAYVQYVQHPPSPGGTPLGWYGPVAEGFAAWVILFALIGLTFWIEKGGKG